MLGQASHREHASQLYQVVLAVLLPPLLVVYTLEEAIVGGDPLRLQVKMRRAINERQVHPLALGQLRGRLAQL